jgi:hypothetical protein
MLRRLVVTLALIAFCAPAALPQARPNMFVYQNKFWPNLHQFLRGEIYRRGANVPLGIDPSTLNETERKAWASAIEVYTEIFKWDQIFDEDAQKIANTLATVGDVNVLRDGLLDKSTTTALNAAAPIYRSHLWNVRQRDNEAWNRAAQTLTDRHQTAMAAALAKAYKITWPNQPYLVDAVGETGANSGFTHGIPAMYAAHIHASVGSNRNTGNRPLELMFHEASHVQAVGGRITQMIEEECKRQNLSVPPDLWHFMIMFTSGEVTRQELAATGGPISNRYIPYYREYNQLPPAVLSAFEKHWLPYLQGSTSFEQALRDLVRDAR